ncbi:hypothetical protein KFL_001890150 [Klebsormidium nitens]|uniref:X8 domain-containing protein n=1 Tax=Klebsormidium nitens TaxID=105231 RepID=A0A1Y1I5L5_KLENI|nr:hypothetical protein KFL_001890150 [Klebsormidium nitens]|eukprot:GAQ84451.1 hypothetical protein KFL_001890150 [Klebsormidium nitens]
MAGPARHHSIAWGPLTMLRSLALLLSLTLSGSVAAAASPRSLIGVNYGSLLSSTPLAYSVVVDLMQKNGFSKVKLFDTNSGVLSALAGTGIEVMVAAPNGELPNLAANVSYASSWLAANVKPHLGVGFLAGANITCIAVGNEALNPYLYGTKYVGLVYPAMNNLLMALQAAGLDGTIKLTIPLEPTILTDLSFQPPSDGAFRPGVQAELQKILALLDKSGSFFTANVYPYLHMGSDGLGTDIPLELILFRENGSYVDSGTGLRYTNAFDMGVDAFVSAIKAAGYPNLEVNVGEAGWPTDGAPTATPALAREFNQALVQHLINSPGTPLRPGKQVTTYFFELLDEDQKDVSSGIFFERHWGLFTETGVAKYALDLTGASSGTLVSASPKLLPTQWCVARTGVLVKDLLAAIQYACYEGGADCTPLQPGGSCYGNNSTLLHASYAFNTYYQHHQQGDNTCNFDGVATVTQRDPSTGTCAFRLGLDGSSIASATPSGGIIGTTQPPVSSTGDEGSVADQTGGSGKGATLRWTALIVPAIAGLVFGGVVG